MGSRENPDMRCFSLFLQKVALYQLCEGHADSLASWCCGLGLRSPWPDPSTATSPPRIMFLEVTPLVLLEVAVHSSSLEASGTLCPHTGDCSS